jgi:acyl carrier protein
MELQSVEVRVRQFIQDNFHVADAEAMSDDASLVTSGVVDSTGMLEIIGFLETEFGIRISDQETTPENLETIGRIATFTVRKRRLATGS